MTLQELKQRIEDEAKVRIKVAENDYKRGVEDCKQGVYDKWFRYNHDDDGVAYDLGWCEQNKIERIETVTFINANLVKSSLV